MSFRYKSVNVYPDTWARLKEIKDSKTKNVTMDQVVTEILDIYDSHKAAIETATQQVAVNPKTTLG